VRARAQRRRVDGGAEAAAARRRRLGKRPRLALLVERLGRLPAVAGAGREQRPDRGGGQGFQEAASLHRSHPLLRVSNWKIPVWMIAPQAEQATNSNRLTPILRSNHKTRSSQNVSMVSNISDIRENPTRTGRV
jgi:hypothetical protein